MIALAILFRTFIDALCRDVAAHAGRIARTEPYRTTNGGAPFIPGPKTALFNLLWARLGRAAQRFAALHARWLAGTLPRPRKSRAGEVRAHPSPTYPTRPVTRLPARHAWIVVTIEGTGGYATQLQSILRRPDLQEFIAAAPQSLRILRPLCRMLGITPPPPPAPRPAIAAPPTPTRPPPPRPDAAPATPHPTPGPRFSLP